MPQRLQPWAPPIALRGGRGASRLPTGADGGRRSSGGAARGLCLPDVEQQLLGSLRVRAKNVFHLQRQVLGLFELRVHRVGMMASMHSRCFVAFSSVMTQI